MTLTLPAGHCFVRLTALTPANCGHTGGSAAIDRPVAVDVEPLALARCFSRQFRREEDRSLGTLYIHLGASSTAVIIARGADLQFVKYVELGGRQLDEAVAARLNMKLADAAAMRRHHGERRSDKQDPEVARTVTESLGPVIDRLAGEIALCLRYHSVTFRGQKLEHFVLSGGEWACGVVIDCVARLLPGVLGNEASSRRESFAPRASGGMGILDFPHYTRPAEFGEWKVPEVLLSGNHEEIRRWRRRAALEKTRRNRPELMDSAELTEEDRKFLAN